MTYTQVLEHFSQDRKAIDVANALKVSKGTVSIWKANGIPYERQCQIEVLTKGQLKAEEPATT